MTRAEQHIAQAQRELISQVKDLANFGYIKLLNSLEAKNYNLTGTLRNSLYVQSKHVADELTHEIEIGFKGYGRLKDLKYHRPGVDIESLLAYVQQVGLQNFKYVPGYLDDAKRRKPIDKNRAELRIAWGLAMGRKKNDKKQIRRRGKGWYNPIKGKMEFDFMQMVTERLVALGNDFVITNFSEMSQMP